MVLVDTSVWINHLKKGDAKLKTLLMEGFVLIHPFVIGEIACGFLKNRSEIISLLQKLPHGRIATESEFLFFIEKNSLMARGLGFVDIHLLASAKLTACTLWTYDKKLFASAQKLGLEFKTE